MISKLKSNNLGIEKISSVLNKDINKKKISDTQKKEILNHISPSTEIQTLKKVEIIIECVSESLEIKRDIFKLCDEHLPKNTIFATNTSSLSITQLANFTSRPEKVFIKFILSMKVNLIGYRLTFYESTNSNAFS